MKKEAYWFSNICPFFSVYDADRFNSEFGSVAPVTLPTLHHLRCEKPYRWLQKYSDLWRDFRSQTEKNIQSTRYQIIYWNDELYPQSLARLAHPPALLFVRGNAANLSKLGVSVVGSRMPTNLGRMWVQTVIPSLCDYDIVIVSGGARGIDAEAHWAAIKKEAPTIAFLPGGVDQPYPPRNHSMFDRILHYGGTLISEFPPHTAVRPENFHRRNRLIVGASEGVIVVEAALKSGTLMTARKARDENVDLFVVPGPPMIESYVGSLELLKDGAALVQDAKDVLDLLLQKNALKKKESSPTLWS